jgi:hypothetical protein
MIKECGDGFDRKRKRGGEEETQKNECNVAK